MPTELLVVIPVFNEERSVAAVLEEWTAQLDRSGADYSILLVDDGSTDTTPEVLNDWKRRHSSARIDVMRHHNRGHGQTRLEGYLIAWDRGGSEPGVCGRRGGQALTNFLRGRVENWEGAGKGTEGLRTTRCSSYGAPCSQLGFMLGELHAAALWNGG